MPKQTTKDHCRSAPARPSCGHASPNRSKPDSNAPRPRPPAPMAHVAGLLILGIILGRYISIPLALLAAIGLACLSCAIAAILARMAARVLLLTVLALATVSAGACLGHIAWRRVPSGHIAAFVPAGYSPLATVTGQISSMPRIIYSDNNTFRAYPTPPKTEFLLECRTVTTRLGHMPCTGLVRVRIDEPSWGFQPGQTVRIAGRLFKTKGPSNPGQFDWRPSARRDGVMVHLIAPAADAIETLSHPTSGVTAWLWRLRAQARQHLQVESDYSNTLLLRALVLGARDRRLQSISQSMTRAGVVHFLSISGQHLAILLGFLYLLLRLMQFSQRSAAIVVLAALTIFLLVAETRSPLLRSAIMAAAFCLATILRRPASALNLLAAAAIVLLIAQPMELFRPGFQLSFGIVAGILILHRPVRSFLFGRWLNRRGLMVFRDDHRVRRWFWHRATVRFADIVSVSFAAWLTAVPLVAHHFALLTPLAPLNSLLMLPLVTATLIFGYLQLLLALPLPNLAAALSPLLGTLTESLAALGHFLGRLPFSSIDLYPLPFWAVLMLILALLMAAYRHRLPLPRRASAIIFPLIVIAVFGLTQLPARSTDFAELWILDVRHGSCAVLRTPSGKTFLLDAGSLAGFDPAEAIIRPFLCSQRWPAPSAAFISHADSDHYNALPGLLRRGPIARLFVHDTFGLSRPGSGSAILLAEVADSGGSVTRINRGRKVRLDDRTTVTVLWPPPQSSGYQFSKENDSSLVFRVECNGVRVLLPGDIEELSQRLLLQLPHEELRSDVLVLPHHGSHFPAAPEFVSAVAPDVLIRSSAQPGPGFLDQTPSLLDRRRLYTTADNGAVRIRFTSDGPHVDYFLKP